ncbi:MAG: signal peptide peptidase SppA [Bacteroidales bacterium]|nr:signal peptide peptidase SppA [Bacteroidales bacterium]
MKNFIKMTFATVTGLILFSFVAVLLSISVIGTVAAVADKQPTMPSSAIMVIDMSTLMLSEQTKEADILTTLQSSGAAVSPVGIYSAITAINKAAQDPAIRFIYIKPDGSMSGVAHLEELRTALENFRKSGKAVVSYLENPTNGGYYLASVSDKIYMTPYDGGVNMFTGLSSQLIFLKDILDRVGVNIQLIRHGKYKSAGEMFIRSSSSPENLEQNKAMVDSMWDSWAQQIADSRGISVKQLNSLINNLKLVDSEDWLENGLVDELLTREELLKQLADLYVTSSYGKVQTISLQDYAQLNKNSTLGAKDKIAVIYAEGNIVDGDGNTEVAGTRFARIISEVRKDTTIKAVVLRVNSPGGSVLAAEKIKAEVDLLQERIPVIASYGDYAASGGYWISANCDKIYTDATTLTGSIGVFSIVPDFSGTINNKLHINITPVNSNPHADMYNLMRPLTPAETAYMQATVESVYKRFVEIVAEGRAMSADQVETLAQGRVWTGAEAVRNGLADEIGNIEDALQYTAFILNGNSDLSNIQIVEYPKPQTTLEMLLESLNAQNPSVLSGTPFENIEAAFSTVNATETGKTYARMPYEYIIR